MSLTINTLISRMKKRLPDPVFKAVDTEFWIDVLMEETLTAISSFYPSVVKGINVNQGMAVLSSDSLGRNNNSTRYVIPMMDNLYPYTGISTFHYPRNYIGGGVYSHNGLVDSLISKAVSATNMVDVRYTAAFEAPNIVVISPIAKTHMDFTISMYRVKKLEEISTGYHEMVKSLYEADCKIALYYKFYTMSDGGSFGGIELKDYIAGFNDYESKRDDLLEVMEADYFKDPNRFEEIFNYNTGY